MKKQEDNKIPLIISGTFVKVNREIYQFGNTLKEGQRVRISSVEPDNFFHAIDENGNKFTLSLTELNLSTIDN